MAQSAAVATQGSPTQGTASAPSVAESPLRQEELEQLLAPIALYPDSLLAQVLMASTYPLEIVQAARWLKAKPEGHRQGARGRDAKATLGSEREVAHRDAAGPGDDGHQDRLDAKARRRVPCPAGAGHADGSGAAGKGVCRRQSQVDTGATGVHRAGRRPERHRDRARQPAGRLRADVRPGRHLRPLALPRLPAVLLLPARLLPGRGNVLVRRRDAGGRGHLGRLQLGRRRRLHQPPQLQQLQPQQRRRRQQLAAQRRPPQRGRLPRPGDGAAVQPGLQPRCSVARAVPRPQRGGSTSDATRRRRSRPGRLEWTRSRWICARRPLGGNHGSWRRFARLQRRPQRRLRGRRQRGRDARRQQSWQCESAEHGAGSSGGFSRGGGGGGRGGGGRR
jgi:hypothetical protein